MAEIENIDSESSGKDYIHNELPGLMTYRTVKLTVYFFLPVLILLSLYSIWRFNQHADPTEIFIFASKRYNPERPQKILILVRNAKNNTPLSRQKVKLGFAPVGKNGKYQPLPDATTNDDGIALVTLPPRENKIWQLKAEVGKIHASQFLSVLPETKCQLTTDKPVYQPGQKICIRALTLDTVTNKPYGDKKVDISITDSRDNIIFDKTFNSSEFGIADTNFKLAQQVNTGTYNINVKSESLNTSRQIEVKKYQLPDYNTTISTDKPFYAPGELVKGTIKTKYIWGKPLANADIKLTVTATELIPVKVKSRQYRWEKDIYENKEHEKHLTIIELKSDMDGTAKFSFPLPDKLEGIDFSFEDSRFTLSASVVAPDSRRKDSIFKKTISKKPLRIHWQFAQAERLPEIPADVFVHTTDPDGRPVKAALRVNGQSVRSTASGLSILSLLPQKKPYTLTATYNNHKVNENIHLFPNTHKNVFNLKTAKAVYRSGEPLEITIESNSINHNIYINIVKDKTCLTMFPVFIKSKQQRYRYIIPRDISGTLQIHAYRILPEGNIVSDMRIIQENRPPLKITADFDKRQYRPGQFAKVKFTVTDANGSPLQAALGISAIDEAVYSLLPEDTFSARYYFTLQRELFDPRFQFQAQSLLKHNCPPIAARFLINNIRNVNNLQVKMSSKYCERENTIVKANIRYGNTLLAWVLPFLIILYLFGFIPYCILAVTGNIKNDPIITDIKTVILLRKEIQKNAILMGLFVLSFWLVLFFNRIYDKSILASENIYGGLVMCFATLIIMSYSLYHLRKVRKKLKLSLITKNPISSKYLDCLNIPIPLCGLTIIIAETLFLAWIFFPNTPNLGLLTIIFTFIIVLPPICLMSICSFICTEEILENILNSRSGMGRGIGNYNNNKFSIWLLGSILYYGPVALFYIFLAICTMSMFLPLVKVVEKLDGGGYSGRPYPSSTNYKEFFDAAKKSNYFNLDDNELNKIAKVRIRKDFPETLYWNGQLITDHSGQAEISFNVADSIANYRFSANAVSKSGNLDYIQKELKVFQDFFINFTPPVKVSDGDIISMPVTLYNYLNTPQKISLKVADGQGYTILQPVPDQILPSGAVKTIYIKTKFTSPGTCKILIKAYGSKTGDAIERRIDVLPNGRKVTVEIGGTVDRLAEQTFSVPANALKEGRDIYVKLYPTPLPQMLDTLSGMLRKPYGCFEQTCSVAYPNVLVLGYLQASGELNPEIRKEALLRINESYQKLLTFESRSGGFGLYPGEKPTDKLSTCGLLLLNDMAKVFMSNRSTIDQSAKYRKVIERTARYLEITQTGNGSWENSLKITAYCTIALREAGYSNQTVNKACEYIIKHVGSNANPYIMALCANALSGIKPDETKIILDQLYKMMKSNQKYDWWESHAGYGIFYSSGIGLDITTTALAVSAFMKNNTYPGSIHRAMRWLYAQGLDHGTQTTIMSMRTMIQYAKTKAELHTKFKPFTFSVDVNGQKKTADINQRNYFIMQYFQFNDHVVNGVNRITTSGMTKSMMGYNIVATYYMPWPPVKKKTPPPRLPKEDLIELSASYDKTNVKVGEKISCNIYIKSLGQQTVPMGMVSIPIPPGFTPVHASLEKLRRDKTIDLFEVNDSRIILYFPKFSRNAILTKVELQAIYPVKVSSPPISAYPYYEPDKVCLGNPGKLVVTRNR